MRTHARLPRLVSMSTAAYAPLPTTRLGHAWGETWRILLGAIGGFGFFAGVGWQISAGERSAVPESMLALDLLVGVVSLPLLLLRRRAPFAVALVLALAGSVSSSSVITAAIAYVSLCTRRRWPEMVGVGLVTVGAGWVWGMSYPYTGDRMDWLVDLGGSVVTIALCAWIGAYIGLRRELLQSLRDRAETAEREQAGRLTQARANERARIAREMHDVLAHRMSLVAMHAGALAYRTDLPPSQVAETATLIQSNAHTALQELRDVLGVLRDLDGVSPHAGDGGAVTQARPEQPQPTLADLDELLRETRAGGAVVRLDNRAAPLDGLTEVVSRHAYRILQEALTNARKHAPRAPVVVTLSGGPGDGLTVAVANPAPLERHDVGPPSSGLGLVGLTERAELSGGRLAYGSAGGRFVVEAWLPWAS